MSRTAVWTLVILVALVAVSVLWFVGQQGELTEERVEVGFRGEAKRDPLLAAQRMIARLGIPAESYAVLTDVPPPNWAMVLTAPRARLDARRFRMLVDWAHRGGHLIVTPAFEQQDGEAKLGDDQLLEYLEVTATKGTAAHAPSTLDGWEVVKGLRAKFTNGVELATQAQVASDSMGTRIAHLAHGDGWITVLADAAPITNQAIGEHQHARMLWQILTSDRVPAGVRLVRDDAMTAFPILLATHAAPALGALALFLVLLAWRAGARFGPRLQPASADRRDLLVHLAAVGRFLWQEHQAAQLLGPIRAALRDQLAKREPRWATLDDKALAVALAPRAGMAPAAVTSALRDDPGHSAEALVTIAARLETLRKSL